MEIEYYKKAFKETNDKKWIEWEHELSETSTHCEVCQVLDKCWFLNSNKPALPQHLNCHCKVSAIPPPIPGETAEAFCPTEKFTGYIFSDKYAGNGKRDLFHHLGFTIKNAEELKAEFEKQAVEKYTSGQYIRRKLDKYGQNIDIEVTVLRKNQQPAKFISGWKVRQKGRITNNTPLGDN